MEATEATKGLEEKGLEEKGTEGRERVEESHHKGSYEWERNVAVDEQRLRTGLKILKDDLCFVRNARSFSVDGDSPTEVIISPIQTLVVFVPNTPVWNVFSDVLHQNVS